MPAVSDRVSLIASRSEVSSSTKVQEPSLKTIKNENIQNITKEKLLKFEEAQRKKVSIVTTAEIEDPAEDRQRTGRYLAVGVTLVMLFIAFYNTVLRHTTVLAGLLAPAIIMLLYILWLLYFAKKRKTQASAV